MIKLTVIANITAKTDKIDLVKAELIKLVDTTRAEDGCVTYDLHQANNNPAHFLFYETWQSAEHLKAHSNQPHIKEYVTATTGAIEDFSLIEMTQIA